jgi:hypothetical protein
MCSNDIIDEKPFRLDLYRRYQQLHRHLTKGEAQSDGRWCEDLADDLLEQAWEACDRADLDAFERAFDSTRKLWKWMQNDTEARIAWMGIELCRDRLDVAAQDRERTARLKEIEQEKLAKRNSRRSTRASARCAQICSLGDASPGSESRVS